MYRRVALVGLCLVGTSAFLGGPSLTALKHRQNSQAANRRFQPRMAVGEGQGAAPFGTAADLRCPFNRKNILIDTL
jgi:hypothetical protein